MINLKFYNVKEKSPNHGDRIVILHGYPEQKMIHTEVEYFWKGYDILDNPNFKNFNYDFKGKLGDKIEIDEYGDHAVLHWRTVNGLTDIEYWTHYVDYLDSLSEE